MSMLQATAASVPSHGQNDHRFDDLKQEVIKLARTHAAGDSALAMFYKRLGEAAANGIVSSDPKGPQGDQVGILFDAYRDGYGKKAEGHYTNGGTKANKSKARQVAKACEGTNYDGVIEMDRVIEKRKAIASVDPKAVRAEAPMLVAWARAQIAHSDGPLPDEEIETIARKAVAKDKELADILRTHHKAFEKIVTGEGSSKVKCQEQKFLDIVEALGEFIQELDKGSQLEELEEKAAELGLTLLLPSAAA